MPFCANVHHHHSCHCPCQWSREGADIRTLKVVRIQSCCVNMFLDVLCRNFRSVMFVVCSYSSYCDLPEVSKLCPQSASRLACARRTTPSKTARLAKCSSHLCRSVSIYIISAYATCLTQICNSHTCQDLHAVSQSVNYNFSSHLGLIRCLTLIVRGSIQHHMHTFTNELGYPDKVCPAKRSVSWLEPNNPGNLSLTG
jgi:hypothetical protein